MITCSELIDRIKQLMNYKTDIQVAKALDIGVTALYERRQRNSIPFRNIIAFAQNRGVPLDLLLSDSFPLNPDKGEISLPNGCTLYWKEDEVGGREYISDEVGGGVLVWNTTLVSDSTLLAALTHEATLRHHENRMKRKKQTINTADSSDFLDTFMESQD